MEYLQILNMIRAADLETFPSSPYPHETILNAATQIYIEQMRIAANNAAEGVKHVLDLIDAEISEYEADIALNHDYDFDNYCDLCNGNMFTSIHNIINKYRRGNNE